MHDSVRGVIKSLNSIHVVVAVTTLWEKERKMTVKASLCIYEAPKSLSLSAIQGQLEPYMPHEDGGSMAPSEASIYRDPSAEK